MEDGRIFYLEITTKDLKEIEQALKTLEDRRAATRKANRRKREREGKVDVEPERRREPVKVKIMTPLEVVNKYKDVKL